MKGGCSEAEENPMGEMHSRGALFQADVQTPEQGSGGLSVDR